MKPATVSAGIETLLLRDKHERRHPPLHRPYSSRSNGQVSRLVHRTNCARDVQGVVLCGCSDTGKESCSVVGHYGCGVYETAEERVRLRLVPAWRARGRCIRPCEACRNPHGHPSSACPFSTPETNYS